jgi:hypothetical protein
VSGGLVGTPTGVNEAYPGANGIPVLPAMPPPTHDPQVGERGHEPVPFVPHKFRGIDKRSMAHRIHSAVANRPYWGPPGAWKHMVCTVYMCVCQCWMCCHCTVFRARCAHALCVFVCVFYPIRAVLRCAALC